MKTMYIGCVTFSSYEGNASSVASGHSFSLDRLNRWLRKQAQDHKTYVAGAMFLNIVGYTDGKLTFEHDVTLSY